MLQKAPSFTLMSLTTLVILLISAVLFFLLIPACNISIFKNGIFHNCAASSQANQNSQETILEDVSILQKRISELELALLNEPCALTQKVTIDQAPINTEGEERSEDSLSQDDIVAWQEKDTTFLNDCWVLKGSELKFRDETTMETAVSSAMEICFDVDGKGTEILNLNGAECIGDASATFDGDGALTIQEKDNLTCSDGHFIYKRIITCKIDDTAVASCRSYQPHSGANDEFIMVKK
jgi:hypothetical protein